MKIFDFSTLDFSRYNESQDLDLVRYLMPIYKSFFKWDHQITYGDGVHNTRVYTNPENPRITMDHFCDTFYLKQDDELSDWQGLPHFFRNSRDYRIEWFNPKPGVPHLISYSFGYCWLKDNDKYHREDGPARIHYRAHWWLDDKELTEQEFQTWQRKNRIAKTDPQLANTFEQFDFFKI